MFMNLISVCETKKTCSMLDSKNQSLLSLMQQVSPLTLWVIKHSYDQRFLKHAFIFFFCT